MTRYGMAVDTRRCFGCQTCAMACKTSNNLPNEVWYNRVKTDGGEVSDSAKGSYPSISMSYLPVACQHCDEPACVAVCPADATVKDPETGIVTQDLEACIGCKSCIAACPYEGVRSFIDEEPEFYVEYALGDIGAPVHRKGVVEKCTFCSSMIERGEAPSCMQLCPGRARYWGDLDDPESEIAQALQGREVKRLNEDAGTEPCAFYLV